MSESKTGKELLLWVLRKQDANTGQKYDLAAFFNEDAARDEAAKQVANGHWLSLYSIVVLDSP